MKCRIERDFSTTLVSVWLYEARESGTRVLRSKGGDLWEWTETEEGALLPEPTFRLPDDALQEIVREATNVLPVEDATTAHLKDAIEVRDRLLTLVERRR